MHHNSDVIQSKLHLNLPRNEKNRNGCEVVGAVLRIGWDFETATEPLRNSEVAVPLVRSQYPQISSLGFLFCKCQNSQHNPVVQYSIPLSWKCFESNEHNPTMRAPATRRILADRRHALSSTKQSYNMLGADLFRRGYDS